MQVFDPSGTFVRGVRLQNVLDRHPVMVDQFGDSGFVVHPGSRVRRVPAGTVVRDSLRFVRFYRDGTFANEIGMLPAAEALYVAMPGRSITIPWGFPFHAEPGWAGGGNRFYFGMPTTYSIEVRDPTGALRSIIRKVGFEIPLTADVIALQKQMLIANEPRPAARRIREQRLDAAPYPALVPAFSDLQLDNEGNLWVAEYVLPG